MNSRLNLLVPLAPLFASLLAGCFTKDSCSDFKGGTYDQTIELTPEEYAMWQQGMPPGGSSTGVGASAGDTGTAGGSDSFTAGGSTASGGFDSSDDTAGGTAGQPTTGDTSTDDTSTGDVTTGDATTGTPLSDQEICMMVCAAASALGEVESCTIGAPVGGKIPVKCVLPAFCEGRRHACVRSHGSTAAPDAAAVWLARAAHDEAASVHAFLALADELAAHGAPAELLARINLATDDERRHATLVADLAQRHGAVVPALNITPTPTRDLLALAVENMVEGCVRETWAALSAAHQARHAHTSELRDLYGSIAADETDHAELAWSIHAWLMGQLSAAERAMVAAARRAAVRQLQAELAAFTDEPGLLALGVPGRHDALQLATGLDAALWSQAA